MSRLSVLVLSLGLGSTVVGCADFTVGVCDCDRDPRGCERYAMGGSNPGCGASAGHHGVGPVLTPVPAPVTTIDAPKPIPVPAR